MTANERYSLPDNLRMQVAAAVTDWSNGDKVRRLWQHDASLWTNTDEAQWLGWLDIVERQDANTGEFQKLADEVRKEKFTDILLLGMGGSSLCPEVLVKTYGQIHGFPKLHVLDSTDPAQVKAFENAVDLGRTLFIVSSKSGSTLEPNIFKQYFFDRVATIKGKEKAGEHFVAVTDPGSPLEQRARRQGFAHVFHGVPSVGGRY